MKLHRRPSLLAELKALTELHRSVHTMGTEQYVIISISMQQQVISISMEIEAEHASSPESCSKLRKRTN
jgi:hypothetical protein